VQQPQQPLFDIEPWRPNLSGIARSAARARLLQQKRSVDYLQLPSRSLLNRCHSPRVPLRWTINPYRGCEFGCLYCYARYTHEFMELRDPEDFENRIFAKAWNQDAFRRDLARVPRTDPIAIGTATDPYQPAERRFGITRSILKQFTAETGRRLHITTKSDLVTRDLDLLTSIAMRNTLIVNFSITTLDADLARRLEPRAPRPDLRLRALEALSRHGIRTGVLCCPVLPFINDNHENLEAVFAAAARAGAAWGGANVVFLKPCAKAVFLRFVERHFPSLAPRYQKLFEQGAFLRGPYPASIRRRVEMLRARYGLEKGEPAFSDHAWSELPQLRLDL
jgi:DNA repair photolyase